MQLSNPFRKYPEQPVSTPRNVDTVRLVSGVRPSPSPAARLRGAGPFASLLRSPRFIAVMAVLVVLLGATGSAVYYWRQANRFKLDPQARAAAEVADLVAAVGRLIVLPTGEEPTVATVADPERLKDQPFFANAKTGDKVLIYSGAKRAILYDPRQDKIVEVAPLNFESAAPKTPPPPARTPPPAPRRR